jgi:branched-chain amino acid transport system substrate-binding protein
VNGPGMDCALKACITICRRQPPCNAAPWSPPPPLLPPHSPSSRSLAWAQSGEIRIAHVYSKTGALEAYGKQTQIGLMMGLEYATGGTMQVAGKKLVVIEKDDQGKPDLGKSLLASTYSDDKADIAVGPTSSGVAMALLPVAEEYKKILLVEPAAADAITGDKWNKYIFRTGRNSSQDAISNAVAVDKAGTTIVTLAQDYAFGRDGVKAFKEAIKNAKLVHEEYLPQTTTDFTAGIQRVVDKLKDQPGRKVVMVIWAGGTPPYAALAAQELSKRFGIDVASGGNILSAMASYKGLPGHGRGHVLLLRNSQEPRERSALVSMPTTSSSKPRQTSSPPGASPRPWRWSPPSRPPMARPNTNKLIRTMEGMSFDTPKGKMTFRKEDHQALQSMYHFRVSAGARPGTLADLRLVREIRQEEMDLPIRNARQDTVQTLTKTQTIVQKSDN